MDKFVVRPEKPVVKYSEIFRVDKDAAEKIMVMLTEAATRGIPLTGAKLVGNMIRDCFERRSYESGEE